MGNKGALIFAEKELAVVRLFDAASGAWTILSDGQLPMGPYHNFAEYNPVHKVVIFGGGNGSNDIYKLDTCGQNYNHGTSPCQFWGSYKRLLPLTPQVDSI